MRFKDFIKEKILLIFLLLFLIVSSEILLLPYTQIGVFTRLYIAICPILIIGIDIAIEYRKKKNFYNELKNWDFSRINYTEENLTNWDMYSILREKSNSSTKVLDLGTGGGENVLRKFPEVQEILATDFSEEMIKTANNNLKQSRRKNITFKQMDNLDMNTPDNYFDIVVARHTCINAKQIFKTLKQNGVLLLRGVDKLDCWQLKRLFGKGQAYNDIKPISQIDYENILDAGFKEVELVPIHVREYYKTKEDLLSLLLKTPILDDFSEIDNNNFQKENINLDILGEYIKNNTYEILLIRRYYGITAVKK
mgnify:CR=1 FL=1